MFTPYYHGLLRRYAQAFGSLFNKVTLIRNTEAENTGSEAQRFVVPIEYTARESWLARFRQDPALSQRHNIIVPRFAFEMTGMRYDPTRKLNSLNQRVVPIRDGSTTTLRRYFSPTPYVLTYSLYAITRSVDDANQITEQILPYFAPDYTQVVRLIPSVNIVDRMRIVMDQGSPQWADSFETATFDATREILLTFTFNATVLFYGPIASTPDNIIRKVMVDLYQATGNVDDPDYINLDGFTNTRLANEDGSLFVSEQHDSDVGTIEQQVSLVIEPDPIDAPAERPVNVTTTRTEYIHGEATTPTVHRDVVE